MLMLLSPAKSLNFSEPAHTQVYTQPAFITQAAQLIEKLKLLNPENIQALMHVSADIADLNFQRFQNWQAKVDLDTAKQCVFAFQGDVYQGLEAARFDRQTLKFAQKHLRVLSGLYGLLRPLDLIQPYRLEMGTKFVNAKGKNLYAFWGDEISHTISDHQKKINSDIVLNLASHEYFKVVKPNLLSTPVVSPVFKDFKNGHYKIISFYAKRARGMMASYVLQNKITDVSKIKAFNTAGYYFSKQDSTSNQWIFLRDQPA